MGSRAQVFIKDEGIYLYTHWGAEEIAKDVAKAIAKNERWHDPEYLARIIFDVMKGNDITGDTGFGIGTQIHGDIEKLVTVNCEKETVVVKDLYKDNAKKFTFEELLKEAILPSQT